jgi:hypothetical protein
VGSIRDLTVGDILKETQGETLNKLIRGDLNNYLLLHTRRAVLNWDAFAIASLDASYNIRLNNKIKRKEAFPVEYDQIKMNLLTVSLNTGTNDKTKGGFIINIVNNLILIHLKVTQDIKEKKEAFNIISIYIQNPYRDEYSKRKLIYSKLNKPQEAETNKPNTTIDILKRPGFTININKEYYIVVDYVSSLVRVLLERPEFKEFIETSTNANVLNELIDILNKN